jgi:hypothetical protein
MTTRVTRCLVILSGLLLAACGGDRGGGPKITLRYHPPAGAEYRYMLEQRNAMSMESGPMSGMGKQELVMRMYFTQAVPGPADGGTAVRITFDSVGMEAPGVPPEMMARELNRMRGLKATVLFDERAQVVRTDFTPTPGIPAEMTAQMTAGLKAMAYAFPVEPVGPGDSWTIMTELPVGQLPGVKSGAGASTTTLTVRSIDVAGTDTTVTFDITTTFPEAPFELDLGGQRATLRLAGTLTGDQRFSITRGAVLNSGIEGTAKMTVTGGAMGAQTMDMTSDTKTTLTLRDST